MERYSRFILFNCTVIHLRICDAAMTLYREIALRINTRIEQGLYKPGERLPGVRPLSEQFGVSISTVVQAQRQLESQGSIEARPRSGYYICQRPWLKRYRPPTPRKQTGNYWRRTWRRAPEARARAAWRGDPQAGRRPQRGHPFDSSQ